MAQFNPLEIVILGDRRHYYSYDGELYTGTFPYEWAKNHLPGTGPKECKVCAEFGTWNGVFVLYCGKCAEDYNFNRGKGCKGEYMNVGEHASLNDPFSAGNTYLKGILLDDIGDKDFMDSAAVYGQWFATIQRDLNDPRNPTIETLINTHNIVNQWEQFNIVMKRYRRIVEYITLEFWVDWYRKYLANFDNEINLYKDIIIPGYTINDPEPEKLSWCIDIVDVYVPTKIKT